MRLVVMFLKIATGGRPARRLPVATPVPTRPPVRVRHAATPVPATGVATLSTHEQLLERAFPGWSVL